MKPRAPLYVLYYTQPWEGRETLFYARRAPGDGGVDWEITKDSAKAGHFSFAYLQKWVKLHGKKCGWRVVEEVSP